MEASMERMLVRCSFALGEKNLGTFWVEPDIEVGQTFKYEFPSCPEREKMGLRIVRLEKITRDGDMYYLAWVEGVEMKVLPPNW